MNQSERGNSGMVEGGPTHNKKMSKGLLLIDDGGGIVQETEGTMAVGVLTFE